MTTEAAVRLVLDTALTSAQITQFIADATLWVEEELASASLTAGRTEVIERYLTCALIRMRELGLTGVRVEDVSEQYQVDNRITDYLLRAAAMDPTGKIRKRFITGTTPVIAHVGKRFSHPLRGRRT